MRVKETVSCRWKTSFAVYYGASKRHFYKTRRSNVYRTILSCFKIILYYLYNKY
jgi:hypothetical protein